jgi:hypothetical protein
MTERPMLICGLVLAVSHLVVAQTNRQTIQQSRQSQSTKAGQETDDTIRLQASLVSTYVSVRDPRGNLITGLTKDDFVVLDDGKQQPITYFSNETDQPLRVAVLIDRSRSVHAVLSRAEDIVRDFISSVLIPGKDTACLVAFDSGGKSASDEPRDGLKFSPIVGLVSHFFASEKQKRSDSDYQGTNPCLSEKMPVGPSSGSSARRIASAAPSGIVCVPR